MALGKFPHEIDKMPASEFRELFICEQLSPFADRRADVQAGIIAMTMANIFRAYTAGMGGRRSFEPVDIYDFMLPLTPKDPRGQQEIEAAEIERQYQFMLAIQHIQNTVVERDSN